MQIHYLGPAGTFSEAAAARFGRTLGAATAPTPCASIAHVVDAAAAGGVGVVPYYNLIDGLVQESLDRVLAARLVIRSALQLPITMALGGSAGCAPDAPVYSHPKALAQCSAFLDQHHASRPRIAVASTAEGVEKAAAGNALAVAGRGSFESRGLPVLADDVANRYFGRQNYTEFLLIGPATGSAVVEAANRCVLACAPQTDRPGLLADLLGMLAFFKVNLARIHSRPAIEAAPTQLDPQVFYFEIAGVVPPKVLQICMESLSLALGGDEHHQVLFLLGEYPLIPLPAPAAS